ncbi:hypothetical protein HUJ05_013321 [Dendroctonus ponderosae]|nr:hypothetical protein HUJ05_013321 [Dendroctonus ponderosae]
MFLAANQENRLQSLPEHPEQADPLLHFLPSPIIIIIEQSTVTQILICCSFQTILSYVASNGTIDLLELMLQVPGLDPNKPDNEGNTPLHFAAQAGQVECLNCLASRCRGVEIDARNNLGFTPLMKAALQGRNKCAKLLLFAGRYRSL